MSSRCTPLHLLVLVVMLRLPALGAPFVLFPQAGQLASPDGRFLVRNVDQQTAASEFAGTFHALWLTELASGRSRKLCDYVGMAAVAWSTEDRLVITQYLGKKTSRALVFPATDNEDGVLLDVPSLIRMVPVEFRDSLRQNDHVFVEASRLEDQTLHLRVWGYGQRDPGGFHWLCHYGLRDGALTCRADTEK